MNDVARPVPGEQGGATSVLIVDDELEITSTLGALLSAEGFEVIVAHNGREGLEQVGRRVPDVVLLDLMMPVMDGRAMCRALRADPATAHVPVVVMTAGSWLGGDECAHSAFLRKPFDVDHLLEVLRRVVAEK